jgi:hypothetical protein
MPIISKDVWITKEGQEIEIRHMASHHLLATIHFIERNRLMNAAEVYGDQNLGDARLAAVEYYLEWPIQYETLVNEAIRRHLLYRGDAATGVIIREVKVTSDGRKLEPQSAKRLKSRNHGWER